MLVFLDPEVAAAYLLDPVLTARPWCDILDVPSVQSADTYLHDQMVRVLISLHVKADEDDFFLQSIRSGLGAIEG
jgi:hypothetical protein